MFSSSDAHMKIYLLSFEWGEILYKNQKCKNFILFKYFYCCTEILIQNKQV